MRFSGDLGDFLITQCSGIVKSCCGDENPKRTRGFSHHPVLWNVKSRYDDEILGAPEDLLITQASEIVKSCYGDEILRGPRGDLLITQTF